MTPVTLWYVRKKSGGYYYNHLEEGHRLLKHPTVLFDSQNVWIAQQWLKKLTWLKNGRVLE